MTQRPEYLEGAGGVIASRRILDGTARLAWAVRERSVNPQDNGWRFFSDADDDEYLNDASNLAVADFNTVARIEPAVIGIYSLPVGADLQLVRDGDRRRWVDNHTGAEVAL
ncbi:conserved hypothetical protein [Beutenbergia cavernae DSM 12333]|uniref:Immunity protein Imm33 domain-containing protein n=1 Tax=Beutenbergia cavernae (strain ATCC BAA-8 / DSM 12333 / CCUG 43141 / JCM 11478 / NBRC 16432 / NCIMB 13614 / HKI 0122) TaxID=471853 RepID=C5BZG8_BEUC1|nr:DUF2185 domain-containing protein [Beutenbergia cavernae]ACQ79140.1 conserved hypothetical protein [Beutenbergia cavernae DSM 12333]